MTPPSGVYGLAQWAQIINYTTVQGEYLAGGYKVCTQPQGLDNFYPIKLGLSFSDSPGLDLQGQSSMFSQIEDAQSFSLYLMWDPNLDSNSIYVPIALVSWSWDGLASLSGSSYTVSGSPASNSVSSTTSWPSWTVNDKNGVLSGCADIDEAVPDLSHPKSARRTNKEAYRSTISSGENFTYL